MRRAVHIAVSLMVVVLLLRPFDCFAFDAPRSEVAECCLKGKCAPSAKSDACCRNSVPVEDQLVPSKAAEHLFPLIALAAVFAPILAPGPAFRAIAAPARHPPPRIDLVAPSLPLLI
jgi:hypothetical protein